jgi:hypothetical protein
MFAGMPSSAKFFFSAASPPAHLGKSLATLMIDEDLHSVRNDVCLQGRIKNRALLVRRISPDYAGDRCRVPVPGMPAQGNLKPGGLMHHL